MSKIKRIAALLSAAVTMTAASSVTSISASANYDRGDVNNNGVVNRFDFTALEAYISGKTYTGVTNSSADLTGDGKVNKLDLLVMRGILDGQEYGDVNNDGAVTTADQIFLLQYILGKRPAGVTLNSADLTKDGVVNDWDYAAMKDFLLGYDKRTLFVKGSNVEFKAGSVFLDDGTYYATIQADGNVVVYKRSSKGVSAVYATSTDFYEDFKDYKIVFQSDGNIVVYAKPNYPGASERPIWDTSTWCKKDNTRNHPYKLSFGENGQLLWHGEDGQLWNIKDLKDINNKEKDNKVPDTRLPLTFDERKLVAKYRIEYSLSHNKEWWEGFLYSKFEDAALDFIFYFNEISIARRREYGTTINWIRDDKGKIKYKLDFKFSGDEAISIEGRERGATVVAGKGPDFQFKWINGGDLGSPVAYVHTHGHQAEHIDGWKNNYFSYEDNGVDENDENYAKADTNIAYETNVVAYLGAPNGNILKFDPNTKENREHKPTQYIGTGVDVTDKKGNLIKAPNDPKRVKQLRDDPEIYKRLKEQYGIK